MKSFVVEWKKPFVTFIKRKLAGNEISMKFSCENRLYWVSRVQFSFQLVSLKIKSLLLSINSMTMKRSNHFYFHATMNSESQIERSKLVIPIMSDFMQLPIQKFIEIQLNFCHIFLSKIICCLFIWQTSKWFLIFTLKTDKYLNLRLIIKREWISLKKIKPSRSFLPS